MKEYKEINKSFWTYIIPSILVTSLGMFYSILDGLFIGNALGDPGLASINLVWPITAFITALATGIGVGGAVNLAILRGEKKENDLLNTMGNTLFLLALSSILISSLLYFLAPAILRLLGAQDLIFDYALDYGRVIILGSFFQLFSLGVNPLLRNQGRPRQAMLFMILGLITNLILDYILIFKVQLGLLGAGLATIAGQALASVFSLKSLLNSADLKFHNLRPRTSYIRSILNVGLSPFGLAFAPSIIIIFTNWLALKHGGDKAVAAYSILGYSIQTIQHVLQGASDGVQPLISYYSGSKRQDLVDYLLVKTLKFVLVISLVFSLIFLSLKNQIPLIFGASEEVSKIVLDAIFISSFTFVFTGIVRLSSSYFYAINENKLSRKLVYLEPLLVAPICLLVLARVFSLNGIWASVPLTQFIMTLISAFNFKNYHKKNNIKSP